MKKINCFILIIFALFCFESVVFAQDDFFDDGTKFQKPKEENFFSKKFAKFKKNKTQNDAPKGYYGSLPNIEDDFKYKKQIDPKSGDRQMELLNDNNLNDENLKKAPYDDDLFLDIIIQKEDNDSKYLKDLQKVKYALENLKTCIEEDGDIQRFNANVNVVELYVKNLSEKYKNEPESQKESFISILNTNYYAKVLGNLKYEANYYKRLIPTNLGQYSSQNISLEEQKLLNRINKALFEINNET